jgi:hypothetical protein
MIGKMRVFVKRFCKEFQDNQSEKQGGSNVHPAEIIYEVLPSVELKTLQ